VKPYTNPYMAGAALGVLLFASYVVTGHGLGASGGLQRIGAVAVDAVAPDHVDRNAQWVAVAGGTRNPLNHWLVWAVVGVAMGGLFSGWLAGRLKRETQRGPSISRGTRLVAALLGGLLVGYAARMARGCTSGQALSGGSVLAVGSWLFMIMVFVGGYLAAVPFRKLWQ